MYPPGTMACRPVPVILSLIVLFVTFLPVPAAAHPPESVTPLYNESSSLLSVTIVHPVQGNPSHYIRNVTITVNGRSISETNYTSQPADSFTYTYPVALQPGDTVEVTAICSLSGQRSATFVMPGKTPRSTPAGTGPVPQQTKQSPGSLLVFATGAGIAFMVRKRT